MQARKSNLNKPATSTNGRKNGSPLKSQPSSLKSQPSPVNSSKDIGSGNGSIQSPQGSQGSSSSEGTTPVHTAVATTEVDGGEEKMPVPPPRRKRKSRKRTQLLSKESESSVDVLSPDESISGSSSIADGQKPPDERTQSHDRSHNPAASVSTHSDQSHDLISDVVSSQSRSPDPFSEDDPFPPHESVDSLSSSFTLAKELKLTNGGERNSLSFVGSNSDAPSSRTSVLATLDSSSNGGHRPYSVLVSPYDINAHFNFPDESSNRIGGLVTLPRGGAQTWSARSSLVSKRQSQRSAQFPSSSMLVLPL